MQLNANEALAELCRRSFFRFVKEFIDEVIPEEIVWNWHIEYLCDELQEINRKVMARQPKDYDLIINIPPGSTKSTIVSQLYPAWVWTVDPSQRIISSSYAHDLSLTNSVKSKDVITSDKYRSLFPDIVLKSDQQSKSDYLNTKGGQRFTTAVGSRVTGMHSHQIIVDDPIDPQQAISKKELATANTHVTKTLSTRKVDKAVSVMILVMQRVGELDPTGALLAKKGKKIKHIRLPAESYRIINGKKQELIVQPESLRACYVDGLLDPIRINRVSLAEAKEDLGSYGFAGQFDQNPAPIEGGIMKREWFEIVDWSTEFSRLRWNTVADTAYTKDEANDPSGWFTYAIYRNDYYIRFAETAYYEFPEMCKALENFVQLHGYTRKSIIEVEPKASGKSLVQTLKKATKLNIKEGKPPSKDKEARAKGSSPTCESLRVKLIKGPWNDAFLDQVCTFPNAAHDEWMDCLTMMIGSPKKKNRGGRRMN